MSQKRRYLLRLAIFRFPSHSQHIFRRCGPWKNVFAVNFLCAIDPEWVGRPRHSTSALSLTLQKYASERASIKILQRWSKSWRWREERAKSENHDQRHPQHHRSPLLTLLDPFTKSRFFFLYGKWLTESAELKFSVRWMGNNMQRDGRNRNEIQKNSSSYYLLLCAR